MRFELGAQSGLAAVPNRLDLDEATLLANLWAVQVRNGIIPDGELKVIEETIEVVWGQKTARFANFSVEMETGTDKTHVYVRTGLKSDSIDSLGARRLASFCISDGGW